MTAEPIPSDDDLFPSPKTGWRRRRVIVLIGAAVVLIGGATGLSLWLTSDSPVAGLVVTTQVVSVTTGTIQQTVAASGTLEPANEANLNFAVSGTVTGVDVKAGQVVKTGQVLATVGTSALQASVDAAQAQLAAADSKLSSDQASGASATDIDSDDASVTSAESTLSTAETSLSDASLTSTIAGTVASVSLTVGQQVSGSGGGGGSAASSSGSAASGQVVVIGTSSYIVNTTVDDTQIGQIAEGDQATITPTGATTADYGTVSSIGLIASTSSDVASFPVVITVTGDPSGLFAGSSADVSIIVKQLNDVTEVSTAAITYDNAQAQVTQVLSGRHVTKSVTVGEAEAGETQITAGLAAGDKVLERVVTFKGTGTGTGSGIFGGGGTGRFGGGGTGGFGGGGFGGGGGGGGLTTGGG
jgi:multidrug efflux pump subunit AcrA (membrane-fusion protein)